MVQYYVLFPYVEPFQPFLIYQVWVVIWLDNSITLSRQVFLALVFMDARMGGVVPLQLLTWKFHLEVPS
jgi:hypothetical protein